MIKSLNRDDIQVTPFIAAKTWNVQNIDSEDLILWMSGSLTGSLAYTYIDFGDGTSAPITNSYCDLALQQQDPLTAQIHYQRGISSSNIYFPIDSPYYDSGSQPVNDDGTFMGVVYNTHKQLFYNTYDNPTQLWGLENINLTNNKRLLTDAMDVFTLNTHQFGEKIIPNSVVLVDNQSDNKYTIIDDGKTNLILDGNYFNKFQILVP